MKRTLSLKFILSFAAVILISFLFTSTIGSQLIESNVLKSSSTRTYALAGNLADRQALNYYQSGSTLSDLYDDLKSIAAAENVRIWLIDPSGTILLNTDSALTNNNEQIEDFDPILLGSSYYTVGSFFSCFQERMVSVMVPVTYNLNLRGYVAIHYPYSAVIDQRESLLLTFYIVAAGIFLILAVSLIFLLFQIYGPLRKITLGAKEYASGNLAYKIPVNSDDELGYLANTLNYMASELEKTGEFQRKFIANVSHDFRSPLTSIKGYIEAMLDGTIPPEMQERYLKIVLNEAERLNKLTAEMLTLNNLDNKGFLLNITKFDINQMIKNTAASFEGTCTEKKIQLELLLTEETMLVSADVGRIQQVLYNLLDNAIKFSPQDSSIEIETTVRHEKLYISVRDHGVGIPRESIQKIWNRFYKIDASRGKDKRGTGLGLSIVQEIIQAHGQKIDVISTEGAGTEFIFTLKLADN
ncbi:MAG: HAMP domain-containing sensor histidine kinase [Lachnospiraceae bacterium]|nr:HAMP domain-containing sensor histidine kinase [Lachnospiraceae bacterium]